MPTGYTAAIADGISFEQFVWNCARAFGALVSMRDDPLDSKIPARFEPSSYHATASAEARADLARIEAMNEQEAEAAAGASFDKQLKSRDDYVASKATLRMQYSDMRARVEAWIPPSEDHAGLRRFMLEQIDMSINFDTTVYGEAPKRQTCEEWKAMRIADLRRDAEYHDKAHAEEVKRTEERNAWVDALRKSVPMP